MKRLLLIILLILTVTSFMSADNKVSGDWRIPVSSPVEYSSLSSWIVNLTFEFGGFGGTGK